MLTVAMELGAYMTVFGGYCDTIEEAKNALKDTIESKKALKVFEELVSRQGGDTAYVENEGLFELGKIVLDVYLGEDGMMLYVNEINTEDIGLASLKLGAGRMDKKSTIDLSVGIILHKKLGDRIEGKTKIATIYANDMDKARNAENIIKNAYKLGEEKCEQIVIIKKVIDILN